MQEGRKAVHRIDLCAHTNRLRHRHPVEKLTLAGGMLFLSLVLPSIPTASLILVIMAVVTVGGAGIPVRTYAWVLSAPTGFLLAGAVTMMLSLSREPYGGWALSFSPEGSALAVRTSLRSLAAVSCLLFLALTTPPADMLHVLRRCRIPGGVVEVALLIYGFLFLFEETLQAVRVAQASRAGYGGLRRSYRSMGLLISSLFRRVMDRAHRLEMGLAARGYRGDLRVLTLGHSISRRLMVAILALEMGVTILGLWMRGRGLV